MKLNQQQKNQLKTEAEQEIRALGSRLQTDIDRYGEMIDGQKKLIPQLSLHDLDTLAEASAVNDELMAKIDLFRERKHQLEAIQQSPYFLKLKITWKDSGKTEDIYISKYSLTQENIYSWFSPIATLRYGEIGATEYEKPDGSVQQGEISRKDDFIIQSADIVFMTHETDQMERQVVYQKHLDERKEFLLPEIVAELDRLQDQIIRTDPAGPFLISGPAGSGKTTLALHRVAYLVLSPEFKEFFEPERIMVFVADRDAVTYFSQLLPELGIHGVKINTFEDWSVMMVNSRFRTKVKNRFKFLTEEVATEFIESANPYPNLHPSLTFAEYRKIKQEWIQQLDIKEGHAKPVYPTLFEHYENALIGVDEELANCFRKFLKLQQQNRYLDEVDLIILLKSISDPIEPFVHVVVDEVQNWLPQQLDFVTSITSRVYRAVSYIGDIRQKTKAFTVNDWSEVSKEFAEQSPRQVELLKVYRNTKQILQHLHDKGYKITVENKAREGEAVTEMNYKDSDDLQQKVETLINKHQENHPDTPIGILAKYPESLAGLGHLAFAQDNIHTLTISAAQGLEFHTVIIIDPETMDTSDETYLDSVGYSSAAEFTAQDKHLYYVGVTRAKEKLILISRG